MEPRDQGYVDCYRHILGLVMAEDQTLESLTEAINNGAEVLRGTMIDKYGEAVFN